jgi:tetratricopeptide (TPR) repeat protein
MFRKRSARAKPGAEGPELEKLQQVAGTDHGRRAVQRRWARRIPGLLARAAALTAVLGVKYVVCTDEIDCADLPLDTSAGILAQVCGREYEESRDPKIGLHYAKALHRLGNRAAAREVATALLVTSVRADALLLLGRIARLDERFDDATSALERALELHRAQKRMGAVAEDEQAMADVLADQQRYTEALRLLDRCIADARLGHAPRIEGYCHLSAGQILGDIGFYRGARTELDAAVPLLESDRDLAVLHSERGNRHQDVGQHAHAVLAFETALPKAERAQLLPLVRSIHLNLADSLAELGETDEAEKHLREARALDLQDEFLADRLHLEGRIAHRRGSGSAAALLERAYAATDVEDDNQRIDIAVLRARIAFAADQLESARLWAQRGVDNVEGIRRDQSAIELRSWILASRREPYELLFTALARLRRTDDALLVFDQWYGRSLLEAISRPQDGQLALQTAALQSEELQALLPMLSSAPVMKTEARGFILGSVRSADLLALIVTGEEIWRVVATAGHIELTSLGSRQTLRPLLDRFVGDPADKDRAEALGQLILPDAIARETSEALRVVLDGPLASLPVVALRHQGRPLVALRPVIQSPRLSAVRCVAATDAPRRAAALVLADARGDLPAARREARRVAALLGTTALVGDAATSQALLNPAPIDLLHIATHAEPRMNGGVLRLHDRAVSALEIWQRGPLAKKVVLAACSSARATDEGATTLANAFLARGARQVVATVRPVTDDGAEELTASFYRAGGAVDPVRALASAQRDLAETGNRDWPYFATFGQDICRTTP